MMQIVSFIVFAALGSVATAHAKGEAAPASDAVGTDGTEQVASDVDLPTAEDDEEAPAGE